MQFELDEERALLRQATRDLLAKEAPLADARAVMEQTAEGFSKALLGKLAELGYLGLALPESKGGAGIGRVGLVAVLEEMGRAAFPGPYLDLVMAAELLAGAAGEPAAGWLRRLLAGEALVVVAARESLGAEDDAARARFADGRVQGLKRFVPFGADADALLATTAQGLALVPRPSEGWNATPLATLDHAQRFAEIALDAPAVLLADAAGSAAALVEAGRLGSLGAAAQLLGLMGRALELTVAYMRERQAFRAPIATFQALQHRAADMLMRTECTRAAVYRAAWMADHEPARAALPIAAAKAYAGDAGRFVCGEAIQLHGGVGFTWEYDPHVYFKRVKTLEQFYGSTSAQLELALAASLAYANVKRP
jgi:alkylation response protein AidB-like acyl-CoA dehydrogenase